MEQGSGRGTLRYSLKRRRNSPGRGVFGSGGDDITTESPEKTYELAAPVSAIPCWAIYADYDGNAPDTEHLVWCASEELALEVIGLLVKYVNKENEGDVFWRHEYWEGLSLPYVDGYQSSRSWKVTRTLIPPEDTSSGVCLTVTGVLEALGGSPFTVEGNDDCEECGAPPGQCNPRCGQDDRLA